MGVRVFALGVLLAMSGCAAVNPFRLDDQVALFHDDLRWGRMPAALGQVDPAMRATFERDHAAWGHAVQIVDVEVEGTRMAAASGTVRAHYTWTRVHEMDTRETVIETRWHAGWTGSWICDQESVVDGDPGLLAAR